MRLTALIAALLMLTGCGFTPLYGESGLTARPSVQTGFKDIRIQAIANEQGVQLRRKLMESMQPQGPSPDASHTLQISLKVARQNLGVRKDSTTSRANLLVTATIFLRKDGRIAYRSSAQSIVSFNVLDAQYATIVSEDSARERAIDQLAADIRNRLALYFAKQAEQETAAGS